MCDVEGRPQQKAATKDCRFTTLGFTAATGEPVMCAVIFEGKNFKEEWKTCFVCCSENSSITGPLLTDMLRFMDDLQIFDRSLGLNPFLILMEHRIGK